MSYVANSKIKVSKDRFIKIGEEVAAKDVGGDLALKQLLTIKAISEVKPKQTKQPEQVKK